MNKELIPKQIIEKTKNAEKIAGITERKAGDFDESFIKEVKAGIADAARFNKKEKTYLPAKKQIYEDIKKDLEKRFSKDYPDYEKEINLIFELEYNFNLQKKIIAQKEKDVASESKDFIKLAKWQQEFAEFLIVNCANEEFLKYFWEIYGKIADSAGFKKEAQWLKAGFMGQVEIWHLIKGSGLNPKLATPEEDAFRQTDIWLELPDKKIAVQIKKEKSAPDMPLLKSTDEITYPAILMKVEGADYYFSARDIEQMLRFKRNCKKLSEEKHINVNGLYVILPQKESNPITGMPSEKMIADFKEAIERKSW